MQSFWAVQGAVTKHTPENYKVAASQVMCRKTWSDISCQVSPFQEDSQVDIVSLAGRCASPWTGAHTACILHLGYQRHLEARQQAFECETQHSGYLLIWGHTLPSSQSQGQFRAILSAAQEVRHSKRPDNHFVEPLCAQRGREKGEGFVSPGNTSCCWVFLKACRKHTISCAQSMEPL